MGCGYPDERKLERWVLLKVARKLVDRNLCYKTAHKMVTILADRRKLVLLRLEALIVELIGDKCRIDERTIKVDGWTQITAYHVLAELKVELANPLTSTIEQELNDIALSAPSLVATLTFPGGSLPALPEQLLLRTHMPPPPPTQHDNLAKSGDLKDIEVLRKMAKMIAA